jgi:hypothetical protein
MTHTNSKPQQNQSTGDGHARREFLKKVGKGSVTVPAAVLLLAASSKQAKAISPSGGTQPPLD